MSFFKGGSSIDLGDTPIENIFIDIYMPMTNGTFVQVYLLGYKYALDRDPNMEVSNMSIARNLDIPLSDVLRAWDFWESKQIIKKHTISGDDDNDFKVEFINLKQLYIDNNYTLSHATQNTSENKDSSSEKGSTYSCSPKDLVEANKVPEVRAMFVEINKIIARELAPNEKSKVIELLYQYNIDPPLIVEAFSYSKRQKNVRHVLSYSSGVIRTWYDQGIFTVEDLQEYLIKQGDRYGLYGRIFKALGFSRQASESEIKIMNTWIDEFDFGIDVILAACENSSRTSNPNINYINAILKDWHDKGVKKLEDIERLDVKPKANAPYQRAQSSPKIKTKFHLANSRGDKYSADELENLILNNQRKRQNK